MGPSLPDLKKKSWTTLWVICPSCISLLAHDWDTWTWHSKQQHSLWTLEMPYAFGQIKLRRHNFEGWWAWTKLVQPTQRIWVVYLTQELATGHEGAGPAVSGQYARFIQSCRFSDILKIWTEWEHLLPSCLHCSRESTYWIELKKVMIDW